MAESDTCTVAWRIKKGLKTLRDFAIHNIPEDISLLDAAIKILSGQNDAGDGFMYAAAGSASANATAPDESYTFKVGHTL